MTTLQSKISVSEEVMFRELSGEAVLLDQESGKYYGLDEVGTRMWSLLAEHGQVDPAYRVLLDEYDVTGEQLRKDLLNLVDELASYGLLTVDET